MPVITFKQLGAVIGELPNAMNRRANIGVMKAAMKSTVEVQKNIKNSDPYPAVNTRRMVNSVKSIAVSPVRQGHRTAAKIFVDVPYSQAMELGAAPHTPPLAPLVEWARYKMAALRRSKIAGKSSGKKMAASQKGAKGKGGVKERPRLSKSKSKLASRMAYLVQQKIRREGVRPRFFMARSMPKIHTNVKMSLRRQMKSLGKKYPIRVTIRRIR